MPRTRLILTLSALCITSLIGVLVWLGMGERKSSQAISQSPTQSTTSSIPETVSFNAHIRPILSDKCFSCHGFDSTTREENLRLDTVEGAYAALESDKKKHAIVPGNPKDSVVWQRIQTADPDDIMPPEDFHKPLSDQEKQLITRWIEQGAKYQEHWAFASITKPNVPQTDTKNPIDAFVRSNLAKHGLKPSPPAEKAILLRRLSLDLIGLPPTPEEIQSFLSDESPNAYEKQVDRLLASPHYGERMAVTWLDAVRYADTVGYHGDQNARIFPFRDYVIDSFNSNKPFDQFTREQLAGDLIPNATEEQKTATGFLRLNLMTREGGAQTKEYLAKSASDRVRAIGGAWLGLTTGCAECHDHKFDPFTIRDFYSLAAFFNDVRQWGVYADYNYTPNTDLKGFNNDSPFAPELFAKNRASQWRLENARQASVAAVKGMSYDPATLEAWSKSTAAFYQANRDGWLPLKATTITRGGGLNPPSQSSDGTLLISGPPVDKEAITVTYSVPLGVPIKTLRLEVLPDAANNNRIGRSPTGKFTATPTFAINADPLSFAYQQADRRTPKSYNNGFQSPLLEETWQSAPATFEEPSDAASIPHHAHFHLKQSVSPAENSTLTLTLASADIGKFRLSVSPFADPVPGEKDALTPALASAFNTGNPLHPEIEAAFLLATTPDDKLPANYKTARTQMLAAQAGYAHTLISQVLPPDKIPQGHLLPRGDWMNPTEKVEPAFPAFLTKDAPTPGRRLNRMDLAEWLLAPENPLTSRHFSNRLWKQFFGKGLSNILDDLGNQGEWPSHPELIDWLAMEFQSSKWDVKHMVRLIVTSETYQQVSAKNPQLAEIDPANRLLSEQSARRLEAEFVRDNALAISGLLRAEQTGGPSILPYQPEDYWANLNFPQRQYTASIGSDQYRRGLYIHWQRTFIHPMLAAFDAPSREECAIDRFQSNSPQQALTLLNDPTFVEAAKGLAARLETELPNSSDAEKINRAYLLALSREPTPQERDNLIAFLEKLRKEDPKTDATGQLCRVILNLHETITRF
ncbi:MAG: PSD1 and planctomycete cytochrome C domain-containing protein [Verrucomicrobiota bacterium]